MATAVQAASTEKTPLRLPQIQSQSIYEGKYRDRTPNLRPAGKLTATGDSADLCMKTEKRPGSPEVIKRFRATVRQDAGKATVFYGKARDPHLRWAADMTHGVSTQPSMFAKELVNPDPKTRFQQGLIEKREGLYASHNKAPLGVSHDQSQGLPTGLDPIEFTFGICTEKDGSAGELVSPDKTKTQVDYEYDLGRDLYRKTHCSLTVSEQHDRNYTSPSFHKNKTYGIPTPHDNDGRHVRRTLKWLHDLQSEKAAPIVSKRVDDFRERTQPQLGKVHDPIKDTLTVPPDHTFGILVKPDEYGAGDLMHNRTPSHYLRGKDRLRGIVAAIRQHLKKANYHNFDDLMAAFVHYDKDGSGKINIHELQQVCAQFNLPTEPELLQQVMEYCDADQDGLISYLEFANFLNWKDKMPSGLPARPATVPVNNIVVKDEDIRQKAPGTCESTPRKLSKQIDGAIGRHSTSANMINAIVGRTSTRNYRTYGVPTIRTDLPAPRIRRIDDTKNYGDESDAYGLVNPSIYSTRGVTEKEFLIARPREDLMEIFTNIGVRMTLDTFDKVYNMAASRHPQGLVSVESFRNVLDEHQAMLLQQ